MKLDKLVRRTPEERQQAKRTKLFSELLQASMRGFYSTSAVSHLREEEE